MRTNNISTTPKWFLLRSLKEAPILIKQLLLKSWMFSIYLMDHFLRQSVSTISTVSSGSKAITNELIILSFAMLDYLTTK